MTDPRRVSDGLSEAREALTRPVRRAPKPVVLTEDLQREAEELRVRQARMAWEATVPARFRDASLEDFTGRTAEALRAWSASPDRNLVLFGSVGVGKTHAAMAAVRAQVEAGVPSAYWSTEDLLEGLKPSGLAGLMDEVRRVGLLLLDDLGAHYDTAWATSRLHMVVAHRWNEMLPTVATTNLDQADLEAGVGPRAYSRLMDGATVLRLTGKDRRRAS